MKNSSVFFCLCLSTFIIDAAASKVKPSKIERESGRAAQVNDPRTDAIRRVVALNEEFTELVNQIKLSDHESGSVNMMRSIIGRVIEKGSLDGILQIEKNLIKEVQAIKRHLTNVHQ